MDGLPRPQRVCLLCCTGQVESEEHFLLDCNAFNNIRAQLAFPPHRSLTQRKEAVRRLLCVEDAFAAEILELMQREAELGLNIPYNAHLKHKFFGQRLCGTSNVPQA